MDIQKLFTIIKKELIGYLATTSNFLVLAGILLICTFMFFNSFYSVGISQLNDLFGLFPWVFALLIPAVAMGIFARERQDKTINILLSYPIREIELVVGKFLGAWAFLGIFPLVTLIIPLSTQGVAKFDWGVITAGFIAAILLIGLFLALNTFISSLFTNSLAVFVVSFIANFVLILLGTNQAGNIIPQVILPIISYLSPIDHYIQLTRGLIRLSDVTYFLLSITALLTLTLWQIQLLRGGKTTLQTIGKGVSIQALAIALLVGAYFSFLVPGRVDITQMKLFTLASGTKNILSQVNDPITFDIYLTKNLPSQFQPTVDDLKRLIEELSQIKSGIIGVNWKYPEGDTALQQEAAQLGIFPRSFTVVSQTEYQAKEGYLGLNIKFKEANQTIAFIEQTDDLEFQVMSRINELTNANKPVLVFLKDATGSTLDTLSASLDQAIRASYNVKTVTIPAKDAKERLTQTDFDSAKIIVTANLTDEINPADITFIQNQIKNGIAFFAVDSGITIDFTTLQATKRETLPLNEILQPYNISVSSNVIYDVRNANLLTFSTQQGRLMLPYPFWPSVKVSEINPLLKDLNSIIIPWSSQVIVNDSTAQNIIETSSSGGVISENISLAPEQDLSTSDLGVKTIGTYIPSNDQHGGIIVIGSDSIIKEEYAGGTGNGLLLVSLLIDTLSQNSDLASIKTKNRIPPQLVFSSPQEKEILRYANIIGAPLAIVIIGVVYIIRRRKISEQVYRLKGSHA